MASLFFAIRAAFSPEEPRKAAKARLKRPPGLSVFCLVGVKRNPNDATPYWETQTAVCAPERPSLLGWRPSLVGWRPLLLGWRLLLAMLRKENSTLLGPLGLVDLCNSSVRALAQSFTAKAWSRL